VPSKKRIEADIRDWFENPEKLLTPGAKAEGDAFMGVAVWGWRFGGGGVGWLMPSLPNGVSSGSVGIRSRLASSLARAGVPGKPTLWAWLGVWTRRCT
jgi:hypothetical protein